MNLEEYESLCFAYYDMRRFCQDGEIRYWANFGADMCALLELKYQARALRGQLEADALRRKRGLAPYTEEALAKIGREKAAEEALAKQAALLLYGKAAKAAQESPALSEGEEEELRGMFRAFLHRLLPEAHAGFASPSLAAETFHNGLLLFLEEDLPALRDLCAYAEKEFGEGEPLETDFSSLAEEREKERQALLSSSSYANATLSADPEKIVAKKEKLARQIADFEAQVAELEKEREKLIAPEIHEA